MQIFVPSTEHHETAAYLDQSRLGKQMVECDQILRVLLGVTIDKSTGLIVPREPRGWRSHPAVLAWAGHEYALGVYVRDLHNEWVHARGRKHHGSALNCERLIEHCLRDDADLDLPDWWGRDDIHSSHRARLLHKDPEYYGKFGWTETPRDDAAGYIWPVTKETV